MSAPFASLVPDRDGSDEPAAMTDSSYDPAMPSRILLVEDDEQIGAGLDQVLRTQDYDVTWTTTGQAAIDAAGPAPFDLVLLDLGLPDMDGIEVCRRLRRSTPTTTIVMLTARSSEIDIVVGLDAGADDYVAKPFRVAELAARVRAHLRRRDTAPDAPDLIAVGDLTVDRPARRLHHAGIEILLRPKEFDLLLLLMTEAGAVITRERIMSEVWDEHWFGSTKTLDMHVSALRRKLADAGSEATLTTIRGVGYRFERT